MAALTDPDVTEFLMEGTRTGKLAWIGRSGAPFVTPIWFVVDGDSIVFNTGTDTAKARAMRLDTRVSFVVDLEAPPFGFVRVDGRVELGEDPGEVLHFATTIGGRYMGADRAEEFGRRNGVLGELVVRLRPDRVIAAFGVSD